MNAAFIETVEGVEPFYGVFVNTLTDLQLEGASKSERWRAKRSWMSFMRENIEEYIQRWPHTLSDLAEFIIIVIEKGRGGENYLENARVILEFIELHIPQEDEESTTEEESSMIEEAQTTEV